MPEEKYIELFIKKKKWMAEGVFDKIIAVTDKATKRKAVEHAKSYILGNWSGIMLSMKSQNADVCCSAEGHVIYSASEMITIENANREGLGALADMPVYSIPYPQVKKDSSLEESYLGGVK